MTSKKNRIIEHVGYYPNYQALKVESDLIVMTDDGSFGKKYLDEIGNRSRILFLRNGVDVKKSNGENSGYIRKKLGITENDFVLMTVSRLANWKRVDRAVEAVADLVDRIGNIKLVIVGDGDEKENLRKLAVKKGISDQVVFAGAIKQNEVSDYLCIADVFLSLYDIANVGNPSFEAMKNGKAIVTINNGDTSSLFTNEETALMVEPDELWKIHEMIYRIYADNKLRKKIEKNAESYADANFWTWSERMNYECKEVKKLLIKEIAV